MRKKELIDALYKINGNVNYIWGYAVAKEAQIGEVCEYTEQLVSNLIRHIDEEIGSVESADEKDYEE